MPQTHYARLGIEYGADFKQIKKAYYRRVKQCHPDLFDNSRVKEEEFKLLVAAFDVLSDPEKRYRYDQTLNIGRTERSSAKETFRENFNSIMDTPADDVLEELVTGNRVPPNSTLATLLLDLQRTNVFMTYREGKNMFYQRHYIKAQKLFTQAVNMAPNNILYRCFLARVYAVQGTYGKAKVQYRAAINLGDRRAPPQNLIRIRRELDSVNRKHMPWWHSLVSLFVPEKRLPELPPDEAMIAETNRIINRIAARDRKKPRPSRKLLDK